MSDQLHALAKGRRGQTRFPGIGRAAKLLGVSRNHLFLVLTGQRASARLVARYHELQGSAPEISETSGCRQTGGGFGDPPPAPPAGADLPATSQSQPPVDAAAPSSADPSQEA